MVYAPRGIALSYTMWLVALTRIALADEGYREGTGRRTRDELARELTRLRGDSVFDWRGRLAGQPPWIVARETAREAAERFAAELTMRGLGVVVMASEEAIPWSPRGHARVGVKPNALQIEPDGANFPIDKIRVVICATLDEEVKAELVENVVVDTRSRSTLPVSHYQRARTKTRALYLYFDAETRMVRLTQGPTSLEGPSAARSSLERFNQVETALVSALAGAIWDRRLRHASRARTHLRVSTNGLEQTSSNEGATDTAARIIGLAYETVGISES